MLGTENGRFPGNGSIARAMNALFAVLSDAKRADDL